MSRVINVFTLQDMKKCVFCCGIGHSSDSRLFVFQIITILVYIASMATAQLPCEVLHEAVARIQTEALDFHHVPLIPEEVHQSVLQLRAVVFELTVLNEGTAALQMFLSTCVL